jgi:uncharacterized coiled-coil DUF342 family protein
MEYFLIYNTMKYLIKYSHFLEKFEIKTDDPDHVKASKKGLNKLLDQVKEYRKKKKKIDDLYKKSDKSKSIEDDLEKIIVDSDGTRNPFLSHWSTVSAKKREVSILQKRADDRAIELSNFKDRLSIAEDPDSKKSLSDKITSITTKINDIVKKLDKIKKEIPELESDLEKKIKKSEEDVKEWIEKIQEK